MVTDFELTLTADPTGVYTGLSSKAVFTALINQVQVIGANISYGYNKLPIATVNIAPSQLSNSTTGLTSFCDFDSFRRNPVILRIKTPDICLYFKGLIDGASISQHPGDLTASFIIKHDYTLLTEVYPRLIGGSAGTTNKFALPQTINIDGNVATAGYTNSNTTGGYSSFPYYAPVNQILNQKFDMNIPAIRFIVALNSIMVDAQAVNNYQLVGGPEITAGNFSQLICALSMNAQDMYGTIKQLINTIDASYTDGFAVFANDALTGTQIQNDMALFEDDIFHGLLRTLDEFGCILVVANNKAFVVPNAPYLYPDLDRAQPIVGKQSTIPNVAYPADYTSFYFNDTGENTIKGVFTVAEPMTSNNDWLTSEAGLGINGFYTEDLNIQTCMASENPPLPSTGDQSSNLNQVFGNIEVMTVKGLASSFMTATLHQKSAGIRNVIATGSVDPDQPNNSLAPTNAVPVDAATQATQQGYNSNLAYIAKLTDYLNQKAQVEYCKIKYADRTGQINMPFNSNWVPGAGGSLYTRAPGVRIDFFVADVTHSFSISAPSTGNASTTVSFVGGRPGGSINNGLPSLELFNYNWAMSQQFCTSFLTDLSSTTGAPIPPAPKS